ncbi:MAG: hypothetical protein MJ252_25270 [archaeon]|nr:hypothetical protein [archaeon]
MDDDYDPGDEVIEYNSEGGDYDNQSEGGVNLEDNFIEAESAPDPIEAYKMIIELEISNSDSRKWSYKSYEKLCQIYIKKMDFDSFKENFDKLLELHPKIDDVDKQDTVREISFVLNDLKNIDFEKKIFQEMMSQYKEKELERDYIDTSLDYAKRLFSLNDYASLKELVPELLSFMDNLPGSESYKEMRLELLVMQIQLYKEENKINEIKPIYRECVKLMEDQTFEDKRLTAIINEEGGKMNFRQMEFDKALQKFKLAFHSYRDCGLPSAVSALKYAFVSSMMSRNQSAIVSPEEANIYKKDQSLVSLVELFEAYEEMDMNKINQVWKDQIQGKEQDIFIVENLDEIMHNIRLNYIIGKLKSYDSCSFNSLAKDIGISNQALITLLLQLSKSQNVYDLKLNFLDESVAIKKKDESGTDLMENYSNWFKLFN